MVRRFTVRRTQWDRRSYSGPDHPIDEIPRPKNLARLGLTTIPNALMDELVELLGEWDDPKVVRLRERLSYHLELCRRYPG